jgi:hypothetical protein
MDEGDGEQLEPDQSPEAAAEAGLSEAGVEPDEDVEFEPDGIRGGPVGGLALAWMADAFRESGLNVPRGSRLADSWPSPLVPSARGCVPPHGLQQALRVTAGSGDRGEGRRWRNIPVDSGNMYMAGVEVENDGIGEPWRRGLLQVCEVVFATLLIGLRRSPAFLVGHKEWAPHRKSDPARIPMDQYRRQVAGRILTHKRPHQEPPPPHRPPPWFDIYVVRPGDTLFGIATRHDMSVSELMQATGSPGR